MKEYVKYQHVERLGTVETDGILLGDVFVFPKIDGTNGHVWFEGGTLHCGSRNRELSLESDNAGFMAWAVKHEGLAKLCADNPGLHVFGEWLVPHSLKTYREDAWRRFYVFDAAMRREEGEPVVHRHYEELRILCKTYGLDFIPPLRIIHNPTLEDLYRTLDENRFLVRDGEGVGEGVVLKNYAFRNKFGRQTWAKIVTSEFKEKHTKEMGAPECKGTKMVEEEIAREYVTAAEVEKTFAKICVENDGWQSKFIPRLLSTVFHDLVSENAWDFVKKNKFPTVNFKTLNQFCVLRIKEIKPELF